MQHVFEREAWDDPDDVDFAREDAETLRIIKENEKYAIYESGGFFELWKKGEYGYMAGNVMNPENFEAAIYAHEEEMAILIANAKAEFGF